jgi:hypothetical protein
MDLGELGVTIQAKSCLWCDNLGATFFLIKYHGDTNYTHPQQQSSALMALRMHIAKK